MVRNLISATLVLLIGSTLGYALVAQLPDTPTILVGTGCGPDKRTMYFADEDQFPVQCEEIKRQEG